MNSEEYEAMREFQYLAFIISVKGIISLGVSIRRKTGKQKNRSEQKVVGFSSTFLIPARKLEAVTQGGTRKERPPEVEVNPGSQYC